MTEVAIDDAVEVYDREGRTWPGRVILLSPQTVCIRFNVSEWHKRDVWFRLDGKQHGIPDAVALHFRVPEVAP